MRYPVTTAMASLKKPLFHSPGKTRIASKGLIFLFLLFAAYTAFPMLEIPVLKLSLSAPLFLLIALHVFSSSHKGWLLRYQKWVVLASAIWVAILLSLVDNGFLKDQAGFDLDDLKVIIRYAYWLLTFVVTIYLVSEFRLGSRLVKVLALAVLATALVRWGEAIFLGKIGAWVDLQILAQNFYGILFSTYSPLILVLVAERGKIWDIMAALIVWGAVVINGSRGSWISVSIGVVVFLLLYLQARPARVKGMPLIILSLIILLSCIILAPVFIQEKIEERFSTLEKLGQDKSYSIREIMIQKGWKLFLGNPLFGVGAGRFTRTSADLDLPKEMQYAPQSHFNAKSAHNSYIALLAETGLAGIIPFILLILYLLIQGYKAAIFHARQGELWALGIYVSFITMSIHLWALSGLTNTGTWVVYGMVAALHYERKSVKTLIR